MSERGVSGSPASSSGDTYAGDDATGAPAVRAGRDSEVGEVRVSVLVEQDVRGLDVPVDDTLPVGVGERARDLQQQAGGRLEVPGPRSSACRSEPPRSQRITR